MRRRILVLSLLFLPGLVQAQVRGGAAGGGRTMISAPRVMARSGPVPGHPAAGAPLSYRTGHARPQGAVGTNRRSGNRLNAGSFPNQNAFLPDFSVAPGLGFDYVHFAATHPGAGRRRGGRGVGFFPFFDSGFLLPYAQDYSPAEQQDESPRYEAQPQDAGAAVSANIASDRRYPGYGLEAVSSYDVIVAPQKPNESYVFVRRDGTLFFAVAYSWADGTLFYVTQEGLRHSVGRDALDLDATQQFNEQRGLSFRSPA